MCKITNSKVILYCQTSDETFPVHVEKNTHKAVQYNQFLFENKKLAAPCLLKFWSVRSGRHKVFDLFQNTKTNCDSLNKYFWSSQLVQINWHILLVNMQTIIASDIKHQRETILPRKPTPIKYPFWNFNCLWTLTAKCVLFRHR